MRKHCLRKFTVIIFYCLQGGYFLKSLAEGAALTLRALLGDPSPNIGTVEEVQDR